MTIIYKVTMKALSQIDVQIAAQKKIAAIKVLRLATTCGLREAKNAIEDRMGITHHGIKIVPIQLFRVKSFVIENIAEGGDVEVDMEGLKLKFLMELPEIGITECAELLKLVQFIEKWQAAE